MVLGEKHGTNYLPYTNVPPEPLFYPNNHTDNLDYQRLLMYLSKCNDEQITAILAIVEAYLRTYKIPTDHDKQDP